MPEELTSSVFFLGTSHLPLACPRAYVLSAQISTGAWGRASSPSTARAQRLVKMFEREYLLEHRAGDFVMTILHGMSIALIHAARTQSIEPGRCGRCCKAGHALGLARAPCLKQNFCERISSFNQLLFNLLNLRMTRGVLSLASSDPMAQRRLFALVLVEPCIKSGPHSSSVTECKL